MIRRPWCLTPKFAATEYDTPANDALALRMARESVVLLKNDGLLPLDRAKIHKIAVLGFNANYTNTLLGNYEGEPSHPVTFAAGISTLLGTNVEVIPCAGCPLAVRAGRHQPGGLCEARARR